MEEFKAPTDWKHYSGYSIFLAGSIDTGNAVDWQADVVCELSEYNVALLNPRRDDWDSSWKQEINNPEFNKQVQWELDGIACADIVFIYFAPGSRSPITLLELGLILGEAAVTQGIIVCCPEGFYRKGNVDIICQNKNVEVYTLLEDGVSALKEYLDYFTTAEK